MTSSSSLLEEGTRRCRCWIQKERRSVGGDWFFPSPQETAVLRWGGRAVVVVVGEDGNSRGERLQKRRAHPSYGFYPFFCDFCPIAKARRSGRSFEQSS